MISGRPILSARDISKGFAGVRALSAVDLDVEPGEIHGLLGANGAGKSTLIGVLSGAVPPDSGTLTVDGSAVQLGSVSRSRAAGIAVVHQELMLFADRSVEENIAATALPTDRLGFIDFRERRRRVQTVLDSLAPAIAMSQRVAELSLAQRQLVEIARALCGGGRVFVLDEPTSALSKAEASGLFQAMRGIADDGASLVFVSHRLDEVFALTDRLTVLRDGKLVGRWQTAETDLPTVTRAMVGDLANERSAPTSTFGPVLAELAEASGGGAGPVNLTLRAGEIVGLAGLEGSGTSAAMEMLGGVVPATGGVRIAGKPVTFKHPGDAIAEGVVYVPADRKRDGLWLERSPRWNVTAGNINRMAILEWLRWKTLGQTASASLDRVGVRANDRNEPVRQFSGGNQQRVMLARAIAMTPRVLLLSDFTRGVDVGAKAAIHEVVRELARQGMAVCLTSSDLDELLEISHRIVFMRNGTMIAEGAASDYDRLKLLSIVTTGAVVSSGAANV